VVLLTSRIVSTVEKSCVGGIVVVTCEANMTMLLLSDVHQNLACTSILLCFGPSGKWVHFRHVCKTF